MPLDYPARLLKASSNDSGHADIHSGNHTFSIGIIPESLSIASRFRYRHHPGILIAFIPERLSPCPGLRNLARAFELYDHAFRVAVKLQSWQVASWCLWGKAICTRGAGQTRRTLELFASARDLAGTAGDRRCVAWASAQIAELHRILGFRDKALREHKAVLDEFRYQRDLKGISWALNGIGQIYRVEGSPGKAKNAFENGAEVAVQDEDPIGMGWALRGLAEIALHDGDLH